MSQFFTNLKSSRSALYNGKTLQYIQDATMLTAGVAAGILQLESFNGFGMFVLAYTIMNLTFIGWFCKLKPSNYFESPVQQIWLNPLFRELAGFVMTWTFAITFVR